MWLAIKALSWKIKLGFLAAVVAALIALGFSISHSAYQRGLDVSKAEIAQYEKEKQALQNRLDLKNGGLEVRVLTQYKDRVQYVDRVVYKTRDVIVDNVVEQFSLSKGWIYAYNQSVRGLELDPKLAADPTPSTVSDMRALADTVAPNNGICLQNQAQLEGLQDWIKGVQKNVEEVNSGN